VYENKACPALLLFMFYHIQMKMNEVWLYMYATYAIIMLITHANEQNQEGFRKVVIQGWVIMTELNSRPYRSTG